MADCRRSLTVAAIAIIAGWTAPLQAQVMYDDGETVSEVKYVTHPEGRVHNLIKNPAPDSVNPSSRCAKFSRNRQRYDYVKIVPGSRLDNVDSYATYDDRAPRMRMKVYTTAPAGSVVELQLGRRDANAYPQGTHSQYQAVTTTQGKWEELEFRFVVSPKGSETAARQVDQVTLLFMPNTTATHVFYFDDLRGPDIKDERSAKAHKRKRDR